MGQERQKGYLCMVLHAHLPYVRHSEYEYFLEENWLYEAMTESYIPLLDVFSRLVNDGIDFKITLSLSPSLTEMLSDELLMQRYVIYLARLKDLAQMEWKRIRKDPLFVPVVRMYQKRFQRIGYLFEEVYKRDLISVLRELQEKGHLEIIPSAATHAYLPHLSRYPSAVRAQMTVGLQQYRYHFGRSPNGVWFPECGFASGFDEYIREGGLSFFFLEGHGVLRGDPPPQYGTALPVLCRSGVTAFGRDAEASQQVWSSISGYPGDPYYRDFYRDVGFDIDAEHVRAFLMPYGIKTFTGLKYYRITGRTERKKPYDYELAKTRALEHARHYAGNREVQIRNLFEHLKIRPVITAAYDAELFGHWWFEGVDWLEILLRNLNRGVRNFRLITPSEYLAVRNGNSRVQLSHPSESSWGRHGYHDVWLNDRNDDIYRHLLKATERMIRLADRFANARGILRRALNQAAREVLLSQHSDWTFMMTHASFAEYAQRRFASHICRFNYLYESILSGNIGEKTLIDMEEKDRIFQNIDYRIYQSRSVTG